jgi:trk system potassium uptake protein TrkA
MRVAIAGAGNVGRAIARELLDNGHQVLLIDKDPKALKMESVPEAESHHSTTQNSTLAKY